MNNVSTGQKEPGKFYRLYSRIRTKEEAEIVIKDVAYGYYFLAVFQGVIGVFLNPYIILDSIVMVILAFYLQKGKKKWLATILMIYGVVNLVLTMLNGGRPNPKGGTNMILALIYAWAGIRAVQATRKLEQLREDGVKTV